MNIQTQPIDLSQKARIDEIGKTYSNRLSANAFDSLYLWRFQMSLTIYAEDDFFAVKCGERGDNAWFFPCGRKEKIEEFVSEGMKDKNFSLCYIDEESADWLVGKFPSRWELRREEESDEYVCNIADLVGLSGGKYKGVRHKISRIERENDLKTLPISDETIADALEVVSEWEKLPHNIGNNRLEEGGVSNNALRERKQLGIEGVVVYVNGEPSAVFAGFPINEDTVDALVGKSRRDAPSGFIYYAVREYCRFNAGKYKYCNMEEDLGIPGIRLIKEELRPESKNIIRTATQI